MNRKIRGMLNEGLYPGLMGAEDFWKIWGGFKFMFKTIEIAVKNLLGTVSYAFKLMITTDDNELQKIKEENQERLANIRKEQVEAYSEYSRNLDDMAQADLHFMAAVISPTEYRIYAGASYLTSGEDSGGPINDRDLENAVDFLDRALLNEEIRALKKIRRLVSEDFEKESRKIPATDTAQDLMFEKQRQIDQAIKTLQAPQIFVKKIAEAGDIKQIEAAFEVFKGTPYKFETNISREQLKLDAKKMAENAVKSNAQQDIVNLSGRKIENPTIQEVEEACEVILTKSAIKDLGDKVADPQKNPFRETTEELREYYIENIIGPLDKDPKIIEILKSNETGKKYLQILSSGKKALETAAN